MKKLLFSLFVFLTILHILSCGNTSYIKISDKQGEPMIIKDGNIVIYNRGPKAGKSIIKYVRPFEFKEDSNKMIKAFEKIKQDFNCNITESSIVCLIFGNEIISLDSRKVEEDMSSISAVYSITVKKFERASNVSIEFKIVKNVESIDKDIIEIIGEKNLTYLE